MRKNWIVFLIICGVTYAWVFTTQMQETREYRQQREQYERQLVAWQEAQAEREREEAEKLRQLNAVRTGDVTTTGPLVAETDEEGRSATPSLEAVERALLREIGSVDTVTSHVVETALYRVVFSELGARPISWEIKSSEFVTNVASTPGDPQNPEDVTVRMIPQVAESNEREYPLALTGHNARDFNRELFDLERREFDDRTELVFTSDPVNDMRVRKTFVLYNDTYLAELRVDFLNGQETRKRLGRSQGFGVGWQGGFGDPTIADNYMATTNAVLSYDDSIRTRSVGRDDEIYTIEQPVDWAGFEKKFFTAIILPNPENPTEAVRLSYNRDNDAAAFRNSGNVPMNLEILHPRTEIGTGETVSLRYQLFVGPKNLEALNKPTFAIAASAAEPSGLVFHWIPLGMSFLRPLVLGLLGLMRFLNDFLASWGLAIIATTIVVRICIYPLTHWAIKNQARTMIEQQKIRPEMEQIMKKHKNDPMKRNQAVMQLYRDHNINPLGMFRGCFPILLQTPILLALYVVFAQSVELRGQSFLWITDLSQPDKLVDWGTELFLIGSSLNILPLIMAVTNYIQMTIMRMPATDEMQERIQKQMMYMMPIMFVFFLYKLPSGLILYWIVSNIISIGQSVITKRIIAAHMAAHEAHKARGKGDVAEAAPRSPATPLNDNDKKKIREKVLGRT